MELCADELLAAQRGDREAAGKLVEENAGLIWSVVRRYFGRGGGAGALVADVELARLAVDRAGHGARSGPEMADFALHARGLCHNRAWRAIPENAGGSTQFPCP